MKILLLCAAMALILGLLTLQVILGHPGQWGRKAVRARLVPLAVLLVILAVDAWGIAVMMPREKDMVTIRASYSGEALPEGAGLELVDVTVNGIKQVKSAIETNRWVKKDRGYQLDAVDLNAENGDLHTLYLMIPVGTDRCLLMKTGPEKLQCLVSFEDYTGYFDCFAPEEGEKSLMIPNSHPEALAKMHRIQLLWYALFLLIAYGGTAVGCRVLKKRHAGQTGTAAAGQKNTAMEFYRFLFAMVMILYHGQLTPGLNGYLTVEFFFVIAGWFLLAHYDRQARKGTAGVGEYLVGRVKKLYPYLLFMWIVMILVRRDFYGQIPPLELVGQSIGELLLIQSFGFDTTTVVVFGDWFITCMLPASALIYALLCRSRKQYTELIGPAIALTVLGSFCMKYGNINQTVWYAGAGGVMTRGFWRAMADMSLGVSACAFCGRLPRPETRSGSFKAWAAVGETVLLSLLTVLIFVLRTRGEYEVMALFMIVLLVSSVMTCGSYLSELVSGRVSAYLGGLSMPMYLTHGLVQMKLCEIFPDIRFMPMFLMSASITILFSAVTKPLVDKAVRLMTAGWKKAAEALRF